MSREKVYVINEIVVLDTPNQKLELNMNGTQVTMHLKYNALYDYWTFDLYRGKKPLLNGKKLVLGIDLLARYTLNLGSLMCVHVTSKREVNEPGRHNLPARDVRLYSIWKQDVTLD